MVHILIAGAFIFLKMASISWCSESFVKEQEKREAEKFEKQMEEEVRDRQDQEMFRRQFGAYPSTKYWDDYKKIEEKKVQKKSE